MGPTKGKKTIFTELQAFHNMDVNPVLLHGLKKQPRFLHHTAVGFKVKQQVYSMIEVRIYALTWCRVHCDANICENIETFPGVSCKTDFFNNH